MTLKQTNIIDKNTEKIILTLDFLYIPTMTGMNLIPLNSGTPIAYSIFNIEDILYIDDVTLQHTVIRRIEVRKSK